MAGRKREVAYEGAAYVATVSPDSRRALALSKDGTWMLYPIDGGAAVPVPGILPEESPIRFGVDGFLFVSGREKIPTRTYRLDLASGEKKIFREFEPPDKAGVSYVRSVVLSADGSAYAYQYRRWLSNLFVVEGLK